MQEEKFDFDHFQEEAIQGLYQGKPLTGENGVFAPLLKHFLEKALEGEFSAHMLEEQAKDQPLKNRKNGKFSKQMKSLSGEFDLQTPRDREGTFEPKIVPKRQVIITEGLEQKVIALYAMGNSLRDIASHIKEIYGMVLSATQLSEITVPRRPIR
jgi:putative transposase